MKKTKCKHPLDSNLICEKCYPNIKKMTVPETSEWKCELFGSGPTGIVFTPPKGNHPNLFWRKMQYLILGNKWRKD